MGYRLIGSATVPVPGKFAVFCDEAQEIAILMPLI